MSGLYQKYKGRDLVQPVEHLIAGGKLSLKNNKICCNYKMTPSSPWVVVKIDSTRKCHFFQEVIFQSYGFIHSRCYRCYKVVVKPKTLNQLMGLLEIEKEMDVFSKCGVETRPFVFGNYGGYFYTDSIEEGMERYRQVRKLVDDKLSDKVPVILKRGCTEFEMAWGPSDKWPIPTMEQLEIEDAIDELYDTTDHDAPQPDFLKAKTILGWIEFAYDRGDETYKSFTDGKAMGPQYVTYHDRGEQ